MEAGLVLSVTRNLARGFLNYDMHTVPLDIMECWAPPCTAIFLSILNRTMIEHLQCGPVRIKMLICYQGFYQDCWCKPSKRFWEPCHAQVLVEAAAGIPSDAVLSLRLGPTRRQAPLLRGAKRFFQAMPRCGMWPLELDPFAHCNK